VQSEAGDEHRPAIAVVAGILDMLQVGSHVNSAGDMCGVVSLDNIFATVIQTGISEKKAQASGGEIKLMIFADGVRDEGYACAVLVPVPRSAVRL